MQWIAIDIGGVLVEFDCNIFKTELEKKDVLKNANGPVFAPPGDEEFTRGLIDEKKFVSLINAFYETTFSVNDVKASYNAHIYAKKEDVLNILKELHAQKDEKGYSIAIVTDTSSWQTEKELEFFNISQYSDRVFRSHEIHKMKKDADYFPWLCKELDCSPSEILFIDDSLNKIENARRHGVDTIQFIDAEQLRKELEKRNVL